MVPLPCDCIILLPIIATVDLDNWSTVYYTHHSTTVYYTQYNILYFSIIYCMTLRHTVWHCECTHNDCFCTCRVLDVEWAAHRGRCWQLLHGLSWWNSKGHLVLVNILSNGVETLLEKGYDLWPDFVIAENIEEEDGCTLSRTGIDSY